MRTSLLSKAKGRRSAAAISIGLTLTTAVSGANAAPALAAGAHTGLAATASSADWTVYHHDPVGSGVYTRSIKLSNAHQVWSSPALTGQLYGEPLVSGALVYVATTADVVYALNSADGTVAWSATVGTPVPAGILPCGDVSPTVGIVGTPVIDSARHEIFAVADEDVAGVPSHFLVGLDTATGKVLLTQGVDPPGSTPAAQLQRTGLNLASGRVVFGYGGNDGDCSTYHGWVVSVPETGGAPDLFEVDRSASKGAVWMGGAAPVVDGKQVWVATGNGSTTSGSPMGSDSVLKLTATMKQAGSFTPSTWGTDNAADADLGSASPVLLSTGHVLQAGKSQTAYVLGRDKLGGIGGEQASLHTICGNTFDGGSASVGSTAYLPCRNGTIAATVGGSPVSLTVDWTAPVPSAGPPIVAGGSIWVIDQSGHLDALDPSTGSVTQQLDIGSTANHFPTPSVGDGLLLAPVTDTVVAFSG